MSGRSLWYVGCLLIGCSCWYLFPPSPSGSPLQRIQLLLPSGAHAVHQELTSSSLWSPAGMFLLLLLRNLLRRHPLPLSRHPKVAAPLSAKEASVQFRGPVGWIRFFPQIRDRFSWISSETVGWCFTLNWDQTYASSVTETTQRHVYIHTIAFVPFSVLSLESLLPSQPVANTSYIGNFSPNYSVLIPNIKWLNS